MIRPGDYLYTSQHEWIKIEGSIGRIGITDYAQSELGDVVFVDLPEPGTRITKGEPMFTIESVKAVSDIYAPCSGEIVEINSTLSDNPQLVNEDPFSGAWMVSVSLSDSSELDSLLSAEKYNEIVSELSK
ncbi:MAG TPA: glycine cleavage system protein GcvH [Oligoflexia bacterium]|nr:glycine cleavage system protein GcvH [Oligoflexia bacterium]HMP48033.1 glycine cleavage system protein GcvH [Oligoflexia bacterium]